MYEDIQMIQELEAGLSGGQATPVGVGFGLVPQEDGPASKAAGRPIFKEVEYVKIQVPGEKNTVFFQPATEAHRRRFPKAYGIFKDGQKATEVGTPLEQWPRITRSQVLSYRAIGLHTVEAIAAVHDGNIEALGAGARELREMAKAYLRQAEDTGAIAAVAAEKQALQDQIGAMQAQITDLAARLAAATGGKDDVEPPPPPRRQRVAAEVPR